MPQPAPANNHPIATLNGANVKGMGVSIQAPTATIPAREVLVERASKLIASVRISDAEADELVTLMRDRIKSMVERSLAEF